MKRIYTTLFKKGKGFPLRILEAITLVKDNKETQSSVSLFSVKDSEGMAFSNIDASLMFRYEDSNTNNKYTAYIGIMEITTLIASMKKLYRCLMGNEYFTMNNGNPYISQENKNKSIVRIGSSERNRIEMGLTIAEMIDERDSYGNAVSTKINKSIYIKIGDSPKLPLMNDEFLAILYVVTNVNLIGDITSTTMMLCQRRMMEEMTTKIGGNTMEQIFNKLPAFGSDKPKPSKTPDPIDDEFNNF